MDKHDKNRVIADIDRCIEVISDPQFDQTRYSANGFRIVDAIGILRRSRFHIEGGADMIWHDCPTDFDKVKKAIEMGFDIQKEYPKGILISYLGYFFWNFAEGERDKLFRLAKKEKERRDHEMQEMQRRSKGR